MPEPAIQVEPEARPASSINLTENALRVLERRYLKKDKQGKPTEAPEDMFHRVAQAIASAELIYDPSADVQAREEEFYRVMADLEFLPNSPTLMNAGRELGQLSACFVLPVEDSMESIFDAVKNTALIHKSGGGTGFSFSRLRPETDRVGSTGGVASGPVSFMRAFDTATDVIKQGGMRRGANMAILNVDHPDIEKFIKAKEHGDVLTNFNLSVAVTSEFMEAVKADTTYDLVNPHTGEIHSQARARDIFDQIVAMAWKTGDPGIIFLDRINEHNPTPHLGRIESTNPCGEQPLLPYESCNLGSINLSRMLQSKDGVVEVDYARLARTVKTAVRFLDNVVDVNKFPLPEIEAMTKKTRKIGLGVMGFADMLIQLGIPYDSEEALQVGEKVMAEIQRYATEASKELAQERGKFPAFEGSVYDEPGGFEVRNATRTTIAPTGTLSIIAGCSSGIEPLFALSYIHNILDGARMVEVNPFFEETARSGGFYSEELMQQLATGTQLHTLKEIPDRIKRIFVTAHEIAPEWHVRMQAAFQQSTNNAVSKTVNFPEEAAREDVARVYMMAYELELKGITIYRDKSREEQPLSTSPVSQVEEKAEKVGITPRERAKVTTGVTERVTTGCGYIYVTVNSDEQGICEVFSTLGKAGGCASAQLEAICRLISLALRSGIDVASAVKQLKGIRCPSIAWEQGKAVLSCADAIASVLEKHIKGDSGSSSNGSIKMAHKTESSGLTRNIAGQCPDCGSLLAYQEGCFICHACGYTKC
ncbi:MAG: vitamin B12-dependent ribonucleotide reductase [Dehalococcoidales bacterium]|nr:vitamin B12-dependent ribonucleotide reductase [Dehalococcoidales bacterium]MDZ4230565.1 vitamin B12-dependent ribonucleotide reductase [Dehalococcoidales bacterium]